MSGWSEFIKDAFFPKICFGCHRVGAYICPKCSQDLSVIKNDSCVYCRRASFFGLTHPGCKEATRLDGVKSLFYYQPLLQKIIKSIKYKFVHEAVADFTKAIPNDKINELFFYKKSASDFLMLPVPLHKKRLLRRGFNQSVVFGQYFANILKIPFEEKYLIRKKDTKPQAQIKSPKERYLNIKGAFALADTVKKEAILHHDFIVFDDVWTTGATIKEIARLLKRNGARRVFALTIAQ